MNAAGTPSRKNALASRILRQLVFAGCLWPALIARLPGSTEKVHFNQQIRPILTEYCLECHGPDAAQREADLRLDLEQSTLERAIVRYRPDDSELLRRVISEDADTCMPPAETGKTLNSDQVELLRRWIAEGASYEKHWAFQPIQEPEIPSVANETVKTDIDHFIVAALQQRGLRLSPPISKEKLIRRAYLDLIGLPPEWEAVQAFCDDDSADAFTKVVDRLLDSPRYGERWGRHWLDIARYADTHGGSAIGFTRFPFSYTYRDYVIRVFNEDLPYDRFIQEQLAADQLGLAIDDPALAGLGFLTVGMQYRNRHDQIDDQIDVVTRGLLGLTVTCARCHDHKYDAIPTTDYYSLYATLAASSSPNLLPVIGPAADTPAYREYARELEQRQIVSEDMLRDQAEVLRGRLRMQVGLYLRELADGAQEQDLSTNFLSYRTDDLRPAVLNRWLDYLAKMTVDDPVFGPWVRLLHVEQAQFSEQWNTLLSTLEKENGDPTRYAETHRLATAAPKWNPRVLAALKTRKPNSMSDVADAYGALFGEVHREWLRSLVESSVEAAAGEELVPDEDRRHAEINSSPNAQLRRHLYGQDSPTALPDDLAADLLNRTVRDNLNGKLGAIHQLHLSSEGSPARAMSLQELEEPEPFYVFRRGNPIDRGEVVQARFLTQLTTFPQTVFPNGHRRLGLAEAIVDVENPLTRRVIVNWVWRHHFGVGLVRTPDDFGTRGQAPTHPELLDYLAAKFSEEGWSLKKLHRQIMMSRVYQQAALEDESARLEDPDNTWLWRFPRRRLEMEAMRDAMLAVSGELDTAIGGRPFELSAEPVVPRRTIYSFVNRDIISDWASTFDGANPTACTAKRPDTTVPQQTLFALNSHFIRDRSAAFAKQASRTTSNPEGRVRWMYRRALARSPDPLELQAALDFIVSSARDSGNEDAAWQQFAHVLLACNEFVFVD